MAKGKALQPAVEDVLARLRGKAKPRAQSNILLRGALFCIIGTVVGYFSSVVVRDWTSLRVLEAGRYHVTCSADTTSSSASSCALPAGGCARVVVDSFLSAGEVASLRSMSELGMSFGSGSGGPTIFDVATGAASKGTQFIDAYSQLQKRQAATSVSSTPPTIFTAEQIAVYRRTVSRVKNLMESTLGVPSGALHLASPSFFSRISSAAAQTKHDEYSHAHVDKKQYGSFAYTALLYLSTQGDEFEGGSFLFLDGNKDGQTNSLPVDEAGAASVQEVQPREGRLMFFTSGEENVHLVRPVTKGTRRALTIAFTCDESKSVEATLLTRADSMIQTQQKKWSNTDSSTMAGIELEEHNDQPMALVEDENETVSTSNIRVESHGAPADLPAR